MSDQPSVIEVSLPTSAEEKTVKRTAFYISLIALGVSLVINVGIIAIYEARSAYYEKELKARIANEEVARKGYERTMASYRQLLGLMKTTTNDKIFREYTMDRNLNWIRKPSITATSGVVARPLVQKR